MILILSGALLVLWATAWVPFRYRRLHRLRQASGQPTADLEQLASGWVRWVLVASAVLGMVLL
jgi:hypothetical protein